MGDAAFFQAIQNYLNDSNLAYAYAVSSDLISHLEAVYGGSLTEFFNDWLYNQGYPSYDVTVENWGAGQAKITVNQTQSNSSVSFFEMPLEVRLTDASSNSYDVVVDNTSNGQEFIVNVPFVVDGIEFDPNNNVISANNTTTLSANSFEFDDTISLYPNPVEDILFIKMPIDSLLEQVLIYNNLGQLVLLTSENSFSTATLKAGSYHIQIESSNGIIHKNFIKK